LPDDARCDGWVEVELAPSQRASSGKGLRTAFLASSKATGRSVVRTQGDTDAERQWADQ